ncbi:peptidoglycan editing factor PgeF [soil metagenome]
MDTTSLWNIKTASDHQQAGGAVFVTPDPEPEGARVQFFTRLGGVSEAPFDSLNISVTVGDDRDAVMKNLALIRESMDDTPTAWVKQVAGDGVRYVHEPGFAGEADALVTERCNLALAVAVADCVPVALVGHHRVGMVHSGWRGTMSGISGKAARGTDDDGARAYIGPCIRRCCYEVSEELAGQFAERFGSEVVSGRNLSLPAAIHIDLEEQGIEEVYDLGLCTGCRPDLFYSHRKQGPETGRSLATVFKVS